MSRGISSAQDEYQACMEKILGDMEFVVVFLDVILVLSVSEEEYLEHLRIVFERLTKYGQRSAAKKIQTIQRIAVPRNRKELRRFLGMVNYYRHALQAAASVHER
ncbi:hypothetical protein PC123_g4490 [Phytophthora cactorum]|nr:hypothetical protein PC123_g4490 [Phytophthora cactorum]